jgi:acyl-CoA reductase-like NAD-dependent aldehyde dehydrogenase
METQPTLNSDTSASLDFSTFYNVIKGKLVSTEVTRHGINPATEKLNPEVPLSTPADVEAAVQAAQGSFPGWASTSIHERREALNALADAMKQEQNAFADMLRTEQGMPVS